MSALLSFVLYRRAKDKGLSAEEAAKQVVLGNFIGGTNAAASAVASYALVDRRVRQIRPVPVIPRPQVEPEPVPAPDVTIERVNDAIDAKLNPLATNVTALQDSVGEINAGIKGIKEKLGAIDRSLAELEVSDGKLREEMEVVKKELRSAATPAPQQTAGSRQKKT